METRPKKPIPKILIVVLGLILGLGLALYLILGKDRGGPQPVSQAPETKSERIGPAVTVPPAPIPAEGPSAPQDPCQQSREKLQGLFAYLDRQDYIAARQFKGGSAEVFRGLMARLLASPPAVQRETDDLLRVLQNRAHFFRVLGKRDTLLLRDILRKEGEMIEASLATLYQAMILQETCKEKAAVLRAPLKQVYPYAVFFLNTLGGSSYLMRRDSRMRVLTRYYSVLIIDRANQRKLNHLGLDIRPPLETLVRDLEGAANLTRKEEYLGTLGAIRARY